MNLEPSTLPDIDKLFGYDINALWAMGALYLSERLLLPVRQL
ncbi:MAG: hypothetical protein WC205_04960 [Opitutaceae bacterium]|jgi:hypothetical protein